MSINKSTIDYLQDSILFPATGRKGGTLNIVTGCRHYVTGACNVMDCYAYRMVVNGRLKGHKSYPYGFEPTFHAGRVEMICGKPKLIFLNDMGDVGGDWDWKHPLEYDFTEESRTSPEVIADEMRKFALFNPGHIILLLTKNPAWYRFAEWPENVWCGFSATNNEELIERSLALAKFDPDMRRLWISCEPWLDNDPPIINNARWLVIGGLSGPNAKPVSDATMDWIYDETVRAKRFTKDNAFPKGEEWRDKIGAFMGIPPREYPEAWRIEK